MGTKKNSATNSKSSLKKKGWPRKSKRDEERDIAHTIHGFVPLEISAKGDISEPKGVEVLSARGKEPLNEEPTTGVEIHEQRHG
jgi:hypothetical protein